MTVLRASNDVCTGTPDNPCWVDEMAIDVKIPAQPAKWPVAVAGVALAVTTIGVLIAMVQVK